MANLKSITELPVAESAEGLNLIVNDNGAAKQIAASAVGAQADWNETDENSLAFIKNKPVTTKELMYEWNFSAEDEVYEVYENVDDDLTWLTTMSDNIDHEILVELYCMTRDDEGNEMVLSDTTMYSNLFPYPTYFTNLPDGTVSALADQCYTAAWVINGCSNYIGTTIEVANGVHLDENYSASIVNIGGNIYVNSGNDRPFKSIKIYKITH